MVSNTFDLISKQFDYVGRTEEDLVGLFKALITNVECIKLSVSHPNEGLLSFLS